MEQKITFRELINLMYKGKAPERIKHIGEVYKKYEDSDYRNVINGQFISSVIGEKFPLQLMARHKCITIYDDILDDKEKAYLSNLIKPFKKYIKSIKKVDRFGGERIEILYKDFEDGKFIFQNVIALPTFRKNSMYIGMEVEKAYTLEEIGL